MRRRAARSSADSVVLTPAISPRSVDAVLLDPFRQRDRMDAQLSGGLLLLFASSDQGDSPGTELGGIGMWHGVQPLEEAIT
jgi:hypothetical protein